MSIMFNQICINKEMQPIYIYIYIYIYIFITALVQGRLLSLKKFKFNLYCWSIIQNYHLKSGRLGEQYSWQSIYAPLKVVINVDHRFTFNSNYPTSRYRNLVH